MAKKDLYKFTIQFNGGDPQHQQTAEILNQQGRRKAQFLVIIRIKSGKIQSNELNKNVVPIDEIEW